MTAFLTGFGTGFSLILAIGAQNAFVLKQGLRGEHVLAVVLACAVSDAVLIALGVMGFAWAAEVVPKLAPVMRYLGAAFLFVYGAMAMRAAIRGSSTLDPAAGQAASLGAALATCLALTWLNPHVYLDTVLLIGAASTKYGVQASIFGAGAVFSSFVFFFGLGFGARLLRPIFARPVAWRVLDFGIALVMWAIALSLISGN